MPATDSGYRNAVLHNDFECYSYATEPPLVTLHEHDFCELLLLLDGDVVYHIAGISYRLRPGDLVIVRDHTLHQPYFQTNAVYRRIVVWIRRSYLQQHSTAQTDLSACFEKDSRRAVVPLPAQEYTRFRQLAASLTGCGEYGEDIQAQCALMELLLLVNRAFLAQDAAGTRGGPARFQQATSLMRERYGEPLSLENLAAACYLSKYHFARAFKKEYGVTVYAYLNKVRLSQAKRLIPGGLPLSEIAARCGFGEYNTFLKAFKREYGVSPTVFLKMSRAHTI